MSGAHETGSASPTDAGIRQGGGAVTPSGGLSRAPAGSELLLDLAAIDLSATEATKAKLHESIPHRGQMSLLDRVIWLDVGGLGGVAVIEPSTDAFWIAGHFPDQPLMPGVLQVEAGAQLCCYLFNRRAEELRTAAFTRLEDCAFRNLVRPEDTLYLVVKGEKFSDKRFIARAQGVLEPGTVNQRVTFEARITGMTLR